MAQKDDVQVICPYYCISNKRKNYYYISCEPPDDTMEALQLIFYSPAIRAWKKSYCRTHDWHKCPVAAMLDRKYSEEDA